MKKFSRKDQKLLAVWAADCAEMVLPFFEKDFPKDKRPRKAIEACREWVRTGVFKMAVIRKASLSAHAAAKKAKGSACFAAHAAGQAVATAHVPQHAFGTAYYVLKISVITSDKFARTLIRRFPKKFSKDWKWFLRRKGLGFYSLLSIHRNRYWLRR